LTGDLRYAMIDPYSIFVNPRWTCSYHASNWQLYCKSGRT